MLSYSVTDVVICRNRPYSVKCATSFMNEVQCQGTSGIYIVYIIPFLVYF